MKSTIVFSFINMLINMLITFLISSIFYKLYYKIYEFFCDIKEDKNILVLPSQNSKIQNIIIQNFE